MKKYSKRLFALLLACIMVLACGTTVFAGGSGVSNEEKKITLAPNTWMKMLDVETVKTTYNTQTNYTTYLAKVTIPCKGTMKISMVSSDGSACEDLTSYGSKQGLCLYKTAYGSNLGLNDLLYNPDKVYGFGGKAKVTHEITLTKGTYYFESAGDLQFKFKYTFTPAKTTVSSVKNTSSKAATVKWKKTAGVTGYQIQYSTKSNFSSAKTVTVKKDSTVSKKIKSLKKGTKYYVRIRTYTKVNGKNCYSKWSAKKAIKIMR